MSCLGPCYNPIPPKAWYRVQSQCTYPPISPDSLVYVPLLNRYVNPAEAIRFAQLLAKGNVLQYKNNSANWSKLQKYSKLVRRETANRKTWATQSDKYTNPNTQLLKRVGNINITLDGVQTDAAITCPQPPIIPDTILPNNVPGTGNKNPIIPPPPPDPPQPSSNVLPIVPDDQPTPDVVIPDGGILLCNQQEDPCTGQTYTQPGRSNFHPTSDSDVPGPLRELYWDPRLQTWYPRQRLTMNNSTDKWPVNATLLPAYGDCPVECQNNPPFNLQVNDITETSVFLGWRLPIADCAVSGYIITYEIVNINPPLDLQVSNITESSASLSWTAPNDSNYDVTGYIITYT